MALAAAPSATKTSENPRMKASDERTTCRRAAGDVATATPTPPLPATAPVPRISSSDSPEMYER